MKAPSISAVPFEVQILYKLEDRLQGTIEEATNQMSADPTDHKLAHLAEAAHLELLRVRGEIRLLEGKPPYDPALLHLANSAAAPDW